MHKLDASTVILAAKQQEIIELKRLAHSTSLAGTLGNLIHNLQCERGASCLFLASDGSLFESTMLALERESERVESDLRDICLSQIGEQGLVGAKLVSLMAWVLLGLEDMAALRAEIRSKSMSARHAILAFSRLIAGCISLIFEVTDSAVDPSISRSLVAYFNLIQGKESAGQERALGSLCFGSGNCSNSDLQKFSLLIEFQERSFDAFREFGEQNEIIRFEQLNESRTMATLERLRRVLFASHATGAVDIESSHLWFETCSDRMTELWHIQCSLIDALKRDCHQKVQLAERALIDSKGLLQLIRDNPPSSAGLVERFFDPELPIELALNFQSTADLSAKLGHSLVAMLQEQSSRLSSTEAELEKTRALLHERRLIQRAKALMMEQLGMNEDEAYGLIRKTAMNENRRLASVAESILAFPLLSAAMKDRLHHTRTIPKK